MVRVAVNGVWSRVYWLMRNQVLTLDLSQLMEDGGPVNAIGIALMGRPGASVGALLGDMRG
jgi:hypothetical protein